MNDELPANTVDRQIVGPHGAILLRRDLSHAKHCVETIRRRNHPAWSRLNCSFLVEECAA